MKSRVRTVVIVATALFMVLASWQTVAAQINTDIQVQAVCIENPLLPPNGIIDELGDVLQLTARAAYLDNYCDSIDVGLYPLGVLGVLVPPITPEIIFNCPSGITNILYEMQTTVQTGQGLAGPNLDSCLVTATFTFHPEGVSVMAGDQFEF